MVWSEHRDGVARRGFFDCLVSSTNTGFLCIVEMMFKERNCMVFFLHSSIYGPQVVFFLNFEHIQYNIWIVFDGESAIRSSRRVHGVGIQ